MFVATDYFNKWVEVEAYANIKDKDVTKIHLEKYRVSVWNPSDNCS